MKYLAIVKILNIKKLIKLSIVYFCNYFVDKNTMSKFALPNSVLLLEKNETMRFGIYLILFLSLFTIGCRESNVTDTSFSPLPNDANKQFSKQGNFMDERITDNSLKPTYYFQRSKIHFQEKDYKAALRDVQAAIQLDSFQSRFYFLKSVILADLGTNQDALGAARKAERMGYKSIGLDILISKLYYENSESNLSIQYLRKARQVLPNSPTISYLYGAIYADAQDTVQAFNELKEAIRLDSSYTNAYSKLIATYRKYGFVNQAIDYGTLAARHCEENKDLIYEIATTLLANEQIDSAVFWHRKLLKIDADSWQANLGLAKYHIAKKEYLEAEKFYNRALEYNPNIDGGYYQLGYIYEYYAKDLEKSMKYYKKAIRINRGSEAIESALQRVTWKLKRRYMPESKADSVTS
ncbi:MAG: tetratricopeptide (TPR) repeat protein [Arenicella sp.]|jgi:tetratricopeptide (TPR) repeat protein